MGFTKEGSVPRISNIPSKFHFSSNVFLIIDKSDLDWGPKMVDWGPPWGLGEALPPPPVI